MKARLRYFNKVTLLHRSGDISAVAELKVWDVGVSVRYPDGIKFSLFLVEPKSGDVVLGMDNHKPKGPHLHIEGSERPYRFTTLDQLVDDFWRFAAAKGYQP